MDEKKIQKGVLDYAKSAGLLVKRNVFRSGVEQGWPDAEVFLPGGRLLFIEFKIPKRRPTRLQQARIDALRALGHDVIICDDIEAGKAAINERLLTPFEWVEYEGPSRWMGDE